MSAVLTPVVYQLGIGGIGGFFIGYVVKKVFKIAILLGFFVFSLIYLAYSNVIHVDYDELAVAVSKFANAFSPALGLLTPFVSHLPFVSSFVIGLVTGFKMG